MRSKDYFTDDFTNHFTNFKPGSGILCLGDLNMDQLIRADSFPVPGGEAVIREVTTRPGGSAANCALALSRFGVRANLIARVGRDDPGAQARAVLSRHNVDTGLIEEDPVEPTGLVFVVVTPDGERTMFSRRGANQRLSGQDLTTDSFRGCAVLHISGYSFLSPEGRHAVQKAVGLARSAGSMITCDPGTTAAAEEQARRALLALLPQIDLLFPNQLELGLLTGFDGSHQEFKSGDLAVQAEKLLQSGFKGVVVKLGDRGCQVITGEKATHISIDREVHGGTRAVHLTRTSRHREVHGGTRAVNATGAGDAFAAGFLSAMLSGASLEECAIAGNRAGVLAVSGKLFAEDHLLSSPG